MWNENVQQGRLKQNHDFWKDVLKASQPVLELIAEGYKLPLLWIPPPPCTTQPKFVYLERNFVSTAIPAAGIVLYPQGQYKDHTFTVPFEGNQY